MKVIILAGGRGTRLRTASEAGLRLHGFERGVQSVSVSELRFGGKGVGGVAKAIDAQGTKPALAPLPSEEESRRATMLLESAELHPGHTVLLAPGSNWSNRELMPDQSWRVLARVAREQRWSVAQNLLGCVTRIPGTVGLEIPLEDLVPVGCACGWLIAQCSGFCDVVAGRVPRLTVLHSINTRNDSFRHDARDRLYSVVESGQDAHANEAFLDDELDDAQARAIMGVQGGS